MAVDLVSEISRVFDEDIVTRIATAIGLDETQVRKALEAGVPALLAAIIAFVSRPQRAAKLSQAVAQQESGVPTSLADAIGGSGQKALIDADAKALTSLLGPNAVNALTVAIGRYAGIGERSSRSLLGFLGPVVLVILGQQQRTSGLDAPRLANFVASQTDNVVAALPSGFFVDSAASSMTKSTPQTPSTSHPTPSKSFSSEWRWLFAVPVLIAIGALGWLLLSGRHVVGPETSLAEAFTGNWDTQADSGKYRYRMMLNTVNGGVSGSYSGAASGTVAGIIDSAGRLIFSWAQGNKTGTGIFVLSPDRNSFTGHYSNNGDPNNATGPWTGTRM
jgi:hypothetical protein